MKISEIAALAVLTLLIVGLCIIVPLIAHSNVSDYKITTIHGHNGSQVICYSDSETRRVPLGYCKKV